MLYKCEELILLMLIMFELVHQCYAIFNFKVRKLIQATSKIGKEGEERRGEEKGKEKEAREKQYTAYMTAMI